MFDILADFRVETVFEVQCDIKKKDAVIFAADMTFC